jgi:thioredoxin-like negative regulator of GroEL
VRISALGYLFIITGTFYSFKWHETLENPATRDYYLAGRAMKISASSLIALFLFAVSGFAVEPGLSPEVKAMAERATQEFQAGKFQDADRDFSQAIKLSNGACQRCVEGSAMSKAQQGNLREAYKLADKAIAMAVDPLDKAAAHNCKGDICVINAAVDPKKLGDAEVEYRATAELRPKSASAQFRLGYILLREKKDDEGIQHLQTFLAADPNGPDALIAKKLIANPRHAPYPFAPAFSLKTVKGETLDNSALEGKIVVFDFWATWCPPCRASVPEIKDLSKKYGDRVRVISVSADEKDDQWRDFITKKSMDWDQYRDADGHVLHAFNVHSFPTYIVLDKDGAIVQRMVGLNPQDSLAHRLRDELNQIVK